MASEKHCSRACETIHQAARPILPQPVWPRRARFLATLPEAKFSQYLPLNRQSETSSREGIELDVSTMADWIGPVPQRWPPC